MLTIAYLALGAGLVATFAFGHAVGRAQIGDEMREHYDSLRKERAALVLAHILVPDDDPDFLLALEIEDLARDVERSVATNEGGLSPRLEQHRDRLWLQASDARRRARGRAKALAEARLAEAEHLGVSQRREPNWNSPHDYRRTPER